ncbi:MAG: discoidin domain-containing protein [Sedimentisphaerales bacterium]|nr:discoidin domain-containing protein [Sedimentisphaerales bacterium]
MKTWKNIIIVLGIRIFPLYAADSFDATIPNSIPFPPTEARFVRLLIHNSLQGQPCIDELEIYGPEVGTNFALASTGAKATASSCLPGYPIHQIAHLNDGRYGNSHSWIASGTRNEWAQIEFPEPVFIDTLVFTRDREGRYNDRLPAWVEIRISTDGVHWQTVAQRSVFPILPEHSSKPTDLLNYAFECEDLTWSKFDPSTPVNRSLQQMEEMIERFSIQGLDVSRERNEVSEFRLHERLSQGSSGKAIQPQEDFFMVRMAKRRLFLRAPDLERLERILFVKRHPFEPSHNYSVILDAAGGPGGRVCILEIPRRNGVLVPERAILTTLFDAGNGIVRDPVANFRADKIYFAYRQSKNDYFHLYVINANGSDLTPLTDGPFHDYFPCPLPDGGLSFISTRCKARFLCWRPQAFVLFRMDADGGNIRPLSHANLSEWTPSMMNDGRIIWMRSEYLDKGADFGHTLWAIRPDGTHPELIFGNNTLNCYANGREIPGSNEILCTLVSHGGDLNGPIALLDVSKGRFNPQAITNITPDVKPHYHMSWARQQCFRDPVPISRDYYLCSHAPFDRFGLYIIDRYGNRELLYLDPEMGSMSPTLLLPSMVPPVLAKSDVSVEKSPPESQFFVANVYQGLEPAVKRGTVKYIRICEEIRADLIQFPNGQYQSDHEPFQDWYATPTHLINGPHGWPSYVAKADWGLAPVEKDGSANFYAPAGKVLYFQVLDENFNEIQRMRSVVQLQHGEKRGCIGCHESRMSSPPSAGVIPLAMRRLPNSLQPSSWGTGPFSYENVVQPVWDAKCISCHNDKDKQQINLTGLLDTNGIPASYRTIITKGWIHYFDYTWGREHSKAQPLSFGTVKSKLWDILKNGHYDVHLTDEEESRIKCWTDLNCPLWPDYIFRPDRLTLKTDVN